MIGEIDFAGVYVPTILVWLAAAFAITALLRRLLAAADLYRFIWYRALFDLALLVIVTGAVAVAFTWAMAA